MARFPNRALRIIFRLLYFRGLYKLIWFWWQVFFYHQNMKTRSFTKGIWCFFFGVFVFSSDNWRIGGWFFLTTNSPMTPIRKFLHHQDHKNLRLVFFQSKRINSNRGHAFLNISCIISDLYKY